MDILHRLHIERSNEPQETIWQDDINEIEILRRALREYSILTNPTGVAYVSTAYADKALNLRNDS